MVPWLGLKNDHDGCNVRRCAREFSAIIDCNLDDVHALG